MTAIRSRTCAVHGSSPLAHGPSRTLRFSLRVRIACESSPVIVFSCPICSLCARCSSTTSLRSCGRSHRRSHWHPPDTGICHAASMRAAFSWLLAPHRQGAAKPAYLFAWVSSRTVKVRLSAGKVPSPGRIGSRDVIACATYADTPAYCLLVKVISSS